MKLYYLFVALFLCNFSITAQENDSLEVMATLEEILTVGNSMVSEGENSGGLNFERLSPYILYSGNDAVRKYKDKCDYNRPEDRKMVDILGYKLVNWLETISEYHLDKVQLQQKGGNSWYYLTILGKVQKKSQKKLFVLIRINEQFLLESIE